MIKHSNLVQVLGIDFSRAVPEVELLVTVLDARRDLAKRYCGACRKDKLIH